MALQELIWRHGAHGLKWATQAWDRNMTHRNKLLAAFGLGAFAAVVLLVLSAYLNPAMLINLANLRLCN